MPVIFWGSETEAGTPDCQRDQTGPPPGFISRRYAGIAAAKTAGLLEVGCGDGDFLVAG